MEIRLTGEGVRAVAEMNYGHNPLAYLCSERPEDQKPLSSEELCIVCADGFEAWNWKRKTTATRSAMYALAREFDAESPDVAARIREALA